jgi:hypothetical protein
MIPAAFPARYHSQVDGGLKYAAGPLQVLPHLLDQADHFVDW